MTERKQQKLSKAILDMKFMKKTKERVEKEENDAEGQLMYSGEITDEMRKTGNIIFVETSMFNCRNLSEGRFSYGGMNPEIEKQMKGQLQAKLDAAEKKKEKSVSDVEMARNYSSLVDTVGDKFKSKRQKSRRDKK